MHKPRFLTSLSVILFSLAFTIDSCVSHELPEYSCAETPVSFANDISPIITTKCAIEGCHNGDLGDARDWRNITRIQEHKTLVKAYTRARIMPRAESSKGPLTQDQIDLISCWVDQGAQNN